ncbi:cellulose biosynthesis cyclic di-GMP-binding regulatory protein BcsB [Rhizobium sp. CC-YZS058]|uniref:cellulose biosynthesis cyclic di-GMP-binding regulatory protein BcsB n=1 Tax=Rhizobium sp. CC-YZS058 TaxID=3042153 RepID=UPI002B052E2E|nr:cellulose biosynthesis cyclic di-GMP-binding regulatory protein BcsB [Rhizobium sp. CC-YZS058]MEA3533352.1 cellulose biosynthesis cyclic di-GMP-binding regulatory protein BcsB [Rhizobium sp. CC-YZS058]
MFKTRTLSLALLSSIALGSLAAPAFADTAVPFKFNTPAAAPAAAGNGAAAPAAPDLGQDGGTFRKMAASQYDLFFGGETASRQLSFFALPDEASTTAKLVLTLQTAISAAPERSALVVRINGKDIGTAGLVAGDPRRVEFAVPAGVIQPGYNAISLEADHRHRVDCSIDATYELWTKIDPATSGFVFAGHKTGSLSMVDLMPMSGTVEGRTDLRVILPAGAQMNAYDRALTVIQALTIAGNFSHPKVQFATTPGTGPGIDIYIGTVDALGSAPGLSEAASMRGGVVAAGATDDRRSLVIAGQSEGDLDAKAAEFVRQALNEQPVGTPEGLAALQNIKGRLLAPGETVSLSDLGYMAKPFNGRYANSTVTFTMPSDFYPGAYSNMNFHLNALYAGGLSPNAELVVKANDKVVANIPLSSARGGAIRDQRLPIPFAALRPGQNTLRIEARLPSEADNACQSVDAATANVRLSIDGGSYFDIPNYARVGRYPDIAGLSSGLRSGIDAGDDAPTYLLAPNYEAKSVDAAATMVAKMAFSSGQVKTMHYTSILPTMSTNLIAFGGYDTLPSELVSRMNLNLVNLRNMAGAKASPFEVAAMENFGPHADAQRQVVAGLLDQAADLSAPTDGVAETAIHLLQVTRQKVVGELSKFDIGPFRSLLGVDGARPSYAPTAETAFLIAQNTARDGGLWTVVASKSANEIAAGTDVLTDVNVWNKLGGAVQAFSQTGSVLDRQEAKNQTLFQTQPMSLSNLRLVLASWLANNASIYIVALLASAILLGIGTYMALLTGREKNV